MYVVTFARIHRDLLQKSCSLDKNLRSSSGAFHTGRYTAKRKKTGRTRGFVNGTTFNKPRLRNFQRSSQRFEKKTTGLFTVLLEVYASIIVWVAQIKNLKIERLLSDSLHFLEFVQMECGVNKCLILSSSR